MIRLEENTVFVLGAGFTRAFLPSAPLLVDDFGGDDLLGRFQHFPRAKAVLEQELRAPPKDKVDIERLMTRLQGGMPYDSEFRASEELALLLSEVKRSFAARLAAAKDSTAHLAALMNFAGLCVSQSIDCLTFNYDDVFDEALWSVRKQTTVPFDDSLYWHPDGGYGFFCRPAELSIQEGPSVVMDKTPMVLLKLHGSVNWRIRRGYAPPLSIDAIVHHEPWLPTGTGPGVDPMTLAHHLEPDPFIVPPVLTKESLVEEPVLRLLWSLAYRVLSSAKLVVFLGYSLPVTDIASRFLLTEALPTGARIEVVNLARTKSQEAELRANYRKVFPSLRYDQFTFVGALEWCNSLAVRYRMNNTGVKNTKSDVA